MEKVCFSESLVYTYESIRRQNPEEHHLDRCENLRFLLCADKQQIAWIKRIKLYQFRAVNCLSSFGNSSLVAGTELERSDVSPAHNPAISYLSHQRNVMLIATNERCDVGRTLHHRLGNWTCVGARFLGTSEGADHAFWHGERYTFLLYWRVNWWPMFLPATAAVRAVT
jgi:hypothetical protein